MRRTSIAVLAIMMGTIVLVSGCNREEIVEKHHPAKVEETGQKGIMKVTLEPKAAERIGLQTTMLTEETLTVGGKRVTRKVMPYGALMYDTKGESWTYTASAPLVFVRQPVVVETIDGNRVILSDGPPVGTAIVTVGAAELMGAEHKYGH